MRVFHLLMMLAFGMGIFSPAVYGESYSDAKNLEKRIARGIEIQTVKMNNNWEKYKKHADNRVVFLKTPYFTCSGGLVGPHLVLTANHCVWATADKKIDPHLIDVYAGGTGSGIPKTHGVRIITDATRKYEGASKDYALIVLAQDISLPGYFSVTSRVRACDGPKDVYAVGFPGKQDKKIPRKSEGKMGEKKTESCDMYAKYADCANAECSVTTARGEPGSSGSPVFVSEAPNVIIGLMSQASNKNKTSAVISGPLETFYKAHKDEPIECVF